MISFPIGHEEKGCQERENRLPLSIWLVVACKGNRMKRKRERKISVNTNLKKKIQAKRERERDR